MRHGRRAVAAIATVIAISMGFVVRDTSDAGSPCCGSCGLVGRFCHGRRECTFGPSGTAGIDTDSHGDRCEALGMIDARLEACGGILRASLLQGSEGGHRSEVPLSRP